MATIFVKRVKTFEGSYLSIVGIQGLKSLTEGQRSRLSLEIQEYMIYAGDIAGSSKVRKKAMADFRRGWRQRGFTVTLKQR